MKQEENQYAKFLLTLFILTMVFLSSSVLLTAYQQHVLIGSNTTFGDIKFLGNNTVLIKGHQSQLSQNDIISIGGRDYIHLTGKQVSVSGNTFSQGIRTLTTSISQNLLFEQVIFNLIYQNHLR